MNRRTVLFQIVYAILRGLFGPWAPRIRATAINGLTYALSSVEVWIAGVKLDNVKSLSFAR